MQTHMYNANNQQNQGIPEFSPQELQDFMVLEKAVQANQYLNPQQVAYLQQLRQKNQLIQQYQQQTPQMMVQQNQNMYPQNQYVAPVTGGYNNYNKPVTATYPNNMQQNPNQGGVYYPQNNNYGGVHVTPTYNATPAVTSANPNSRFSSASNNVKDRVEQENLARPAVQEQVAPVAPIVQEPVLPTVPLEGSEYPFLTLPTQVCIKEAVNEYFLYSVIDKEEDKVDYDKHASIYQDAVGTYDPKINLDDIKKIKFYEKVQDVDNYVEAFNDLRLAEGANKNESLFNVAEYILTSAGAVNKSSTDKTAIMYKNVVAGAKDIKELANAMKNLITNGKELTAATFRDFNDTITKYVNLVFRSTLGSEWKIDSFANDMDSVLTEIGKMTDTRKRGIMNKGVLEIFKTLKSNAEDINLVFEETEHVEENKVGLCYMTSRVTVVTSASDHVSYELSEVKKGAAKYIKKDLTPILHGVVDAIYDKREYQNKIIILLDKTGAQFRIMKTKLSVDHTIERIK